MVDLHHGAITVESGAVGGPGPYQRLAFEQFKQEMTAGWGIGGEGGLQSPPTARVEDDEEGRVCESGPDTLVADSRPRQRGVHSAVQEPGDGLVPEIAGVGTVDLDRPRMEAIIGDSHGRRPPHGLVARPAGYGGARSGQSRNTEIRR